jgi:hypothetical protein
MLEKIAAADVNHLLIKTAHVLRSKDAEIDALKRQLADQDRARHAEKIAGIAVERGIMSEDNAEDYAEKLASSNRDLTMVEEFVARNSGAGLPLGDEMTKEASGPGFSSSGSAEDKFTNSLLSLDL